MWITRLTDSQRDALKALIAAQGEIGPSLSGAYEALDLAREHHQLRAVAGAELDHRPAHVRLRGRRTHDQALGDLSVRQPGRHKAGASRPPTEPAAR